MDCTEIKNKLIIYKLVKNHFSLTDESLKLFKHRLMYKPAIASEYKPYLDKDLRCKVKIEDVSILEENDEGWKWFNSKLPCFINTCNITYEMFKNNIYIVNNKKLKLKKALLEFFGDEKNFKHTNFLYNLLNLYPDFLCDYRCGLLYFNGDYNVIRNSEGKKIPIESFMLELVKKEGYKYLDKVESGYTRFSNVLGSLKLPNSSLYLVLSCNFADWFLSSTAESWESCLSLESTYSTAQWAGLPGTITDKNRAMLYITDGVKKNYNGIIADRILARSWIILGTEGKKEKAKTFIHFVGEYPGSKDILDTLAEKIIFENKYKIFGGRPEEDTRSKYDFEMLFHYRTKKEKFLSYIFCDSTLLKVSRKHPKNTFAYHWINDEEHGKSHIVICNGMKSKDKQISFSYERGLEKLVENNQKITDFIDRY